MTTTITISSLIGYIPRQWIDRIFKVDVDGKPIVKRNENGEAIVNPYTGYPEFETLEEGTRFYAAYMNQIENGIANSHLALGVFDKELKKIRAQMELDGRVPNHSGSFADTFDETSQRLVRLTAKTDITVDANSTDTVLHVASTEGFTAMTYATIYDADSYEQVLITAVDASAKTITVQTLTSDYTKGAKIARSTAGINTDNQTMVVAPFVTYQVELVEVV